MQDTGYDLPSTILPKRAGGYEKTAAGVINAPYLDMTGPYAAGALYSTVCDLYKWEQVLYTTQLLSAAGKAQMFTPVIKTTTRMGGTRPSSCWAPIP